MYRLKTELTEPRIRWLRAVSGPSCEAFYDGRFSRERLRNRRSCKLAAVETRFEYYRDVSIRRALWKSRKVAIFASGKASTIPA
jgi:hypothetical protein